MKLGVLGGTFDPIHLGHLHVAHRIQRLFGLSQIHFVVATAPPHKPVEHLIPLIHRYAMVTLATSGVSAFVPSLVELERPASSFSIDTLRKLAHRFGGSQTAVYFIAGGDSLLEVANWRESGKLLSLYNFIFVVRPGVEVQDPASVLPGRARSRVRDLRGLGPRRLRGRMGIEERLPGNRIFIIEIGAPDISSSGIRSLAASGKSLHHLVPASVHEYIRKLRIYGDR